MYSISEYIQTYKHSKQEQKKKKAPIYRHLSELAKHHMLFFLLFIPTRASREGLAPAIVVGTMVLIS